MDPYAIKLLEPFQIVGEARSPLKFIVTPYDTAWPGQFYLIKCQLESVLKGVDIVDIQHVGGTSVPGLASRPIIDIDIIVSRPNVTAAINALEASGYKNLGVGKVIDRWVIQSNGHGLARSIFLVVEGCLASRNHLTVRNFLLADSQASDFWGKQKLELAKNTWDGFEDYYNAKRDMVYKILHRCGWSGYDMLEIRRYNDQ